MQRGKPSVQLYDDGGQQMLKSLESGTDAANAMNEPKRSGNGLEGCEPETEMAGHIVDQLRRAYDELLHEPLPDHLRTLLASLSKEEDKS